MVWYDHDDGGGNVQFESKPAGHPLLLLRRQTGGVVGLGLVEQERASRLSCSLSELNVSTRALR
jgi:hypothetical protein